MTHFLGADSQDEDKAISQRPASLVSFLKYECYLSGLSTAYLAAPFREKYSEIQKRYVSSQFSSLFFYAN